MLKITYTGRTIQCDVGEFKRQPFPVTLPDGEEIDIWLRGAELDNLNDQAHTRGLSVSDITEMAYDTSLDELPRESADFLQQFVNNFALYIALGRSMSYAEGYPPANANGELWSCETN